MGRIHRTEGIMTLFGRRQFLTSLAGGLSVISVHNRTVAATSAVNTVTGPVQPQALGITLMHEHVLVDFVGAREADRGRYDAEEVFRTAVPHLKKIHDLGCRTLVECTPAYLGRDPALLARLSAATGVQLITNTGFYAAGEKYKFLPSRVFTDSPERLARTWIMEHRNGIDGTGIRPGLIKIGVNRGPLPEVERNLVKAAGLAHQGTGLPIGSHTGDGAAALDQLDILVAQGVRPAAFIWIHAQSEKDPQLHLKAAERGAWLEFDGISETTADRHTQLIRTMIGHGFQSRILLSQDAGWYHVGEPRGGKFHGYDFLLSGFLTALRDAGITEGQIQAILRDNPREALTPL
jgi:phosphotriesterase-related protein